MKSEINTSLPHIYYRGTEPSNGQWEIVAWPKVSSLTMQAVFEFIGTTYHQGKMPWKYDKLCRALICVRSKDDDNIVGPAAYLDGMIGECLHKLDLYAKEAADPITKAVVEIKQRLMTCHEGNGEPCKTTDPPHNGWEILLKQARAERDAARTERDMAKAEITAECFRKEFANRERDTAEVARDDAIKQLAEAIRELDDAKAKQQQAHDYALKYKDRSVAAVKRADEAEAERDEARTDLRLSQLDDNTVKADFDLAISQRDAAVKERDEAVKEMNAALRDAIKMVDAKVAAKAERDAAVNKAQDTVELIMTSTRQEINKANAERDEAKAAIK